LFTAISSGRSARAPVGSAEDVPGVLRAGRSEGAALHELTPVLAMGSLPCHGSNGAERFHLRVLVWVVVGVKTEKLQTSSNRLNSS